MDLYRELKKKNAAVKQSGGGDTNHGWYTRNCPEWFGKETGLNETLTKDRNRTDLSIVEIGKNTRKCPGDLRRLAVT